MTKLSRPQSPAQAARLRDRARRQIARIREEIAALGYICSGTLLRRTKVCGKPRCRCAVDPAARHGPYYEWGRVDQGRLVHTQVTPEEGERLARAIRDYRFAQRLLAKWIKKSVEAIFAEGRSSRG